MGQPTPGSLPALQYPSRPSGGIDFYRYVRNSSPNATDPSGMYTLVGFSSPDAAQMTVAIKNLDSKLRSTPCCIDPKLRDKILNDLQPGSTTDGVAFGYFKTIPGRPNGLGAIPGLEGFLHKDVVITKHALDGSANCPLEGVILHELVHLTWSNFILPHDAREDDAYGKAVACFGEGCKRGPKSEEDD